ncbi:MAG TPA: hypothetical protein VGA34_11240, partial [Alteraurantiacibacter sp.]
MVFPSCCVLTVSLSQYAPADGDDAPMLQVRKIDQYRKKICSPLPFTRKAKRAPPKGTPVAVFSTVARAPLAAGEQCAGGCVERGDLLHGIGD